MGWFLYSFPSLFLPLGIREMVVDLLFSTSRQKKVVASRVEDDAEYVIFPAQLDRSEREGVCDD